MRAWIAGAALAALTSPVAAQTAIGNLTAPPAGVEIAGEVTQVFGNRFVVEDATGSVLVETGPPWHHDLAVELGEQVRVRGEPDKGGFDAFTITRGTGETVEIRPADGPPPWAGGPRG